MIFLYWYSLVFASFIQRNTTNAFIDATHGHGHLNKLTSKVKENATC
jgi:hypothetical protein